MTIHYSGGCLCGQLRYQGDADPIFAGNCHCSDCRKTGASGHIAAIAVPEAAITVIGTFQTYGTTADSGNTANRHFCPICGTTVLATNNGMPGMLMLMAATLDDPEIYRPQMVVYASRAVSWDQPIEGVPHFPEMPPKGPN